MNFDERLKGKGIVSNELLGGHFDRMATYKSDGTLLIEATPDFKEDVGWIEGQRVVLQSWDEICRLRDFLNALKPVPVAKQAEVDKHSRSA